MRREVKLQSNCPASVGSAPPLEQVWHEKATPPKRWVVAISTTDVLQLLLQPAHVLSRVRAETLLRVAHEFARLDLSASQSTDKCPSLAGSSGRFAGPSKSPSSRTAALQRAGFAPDAKHPCQCGDSGLPPPSVQHHSPPGILSKGSLCPLWHQLSREPLSVQLTPLHAVATATKRMLWPGKAVLLTCLQH